MGQKNLTMRVTDSDVDSTSRLALRAVMSIGAIAPSVAHLGWTAEHQLLSQSEAHGIVLAFIALYGALVILWPALRPGRSRLAPTVALRAEKTSSVIVAVGLVLGLWPAGVATAGLALFMHTVVLVYNRALRAGRSPSIVFVGSFGLLILVGAAGLSLPAATPEDAPIGAVDALFTATSAVCVTGLTVRDTATQFTRFGQGVILALIQLGGLGIVFFAAFLALVMGSSLSVHATQSLRASASRDIHGADAIRRLVLFLALFIISVEAIGALTLYLGWPKTWAGAPDFSTPAARAFHSLFFAISAFCNAGFATTSDSLHALRNHWTTHVVIVSLIVTGGIGFPVIVNLRDVVRAKFSKIRTSDGTLVRLRLHTKIVLWTTLIVYLAGFIGVFLGRALQRDQSLGQAILDAHFASVTARTAGFDTVAPADMGPLGRFVLIFQMFIGGSPGSTAGGVKTIVFSVMLMTVWATMLGRSTTQAFGRTIAETVVRQAAALIVLGLASITFVSSVLVATDGSRHSLEELLFEAVSACGTVGLSLGVTPDLSTLGKAAVIVGMFVGRVGPLAVAVALAQVARKRTASYAYPAEDVLMS